MSNKFITVKSIDEKNNLLNTMNDYNKFYFYGDSGSGKSYIANQFIIGKENVILCNDRNTYNGISSYILSHKFNPEFIIVITNDYNPDVLDILKNNVLIVKFIN